ncbi:MAG: alcohol dehydrogenase catalytic domain-containing protein [Planctomycetes bacterium]|nr:alcohol dehydrogenase catalytic domain-containing protein [Planctomycetota bacterium]
MQRTPSTMQALVVNRRGPGSIEFDEHFAVPEPASHEVLLRVRLASVCSTDLEIVRGYMGFVGVPGHEFVATVERGPDRLLGKRVVAEINCVSPDSPARDEDSRKHAWPRTVIGILGRDGAFAEWLAAPAENCHLVPDSISDREAVFVEPLAAAVQVLRDHPITPDSRVAVLGSGRLGVLVAQVIRDAGAAACIVGRNAETLALCRSLGLAARNIAELDAADVYDLIVECTGSADGLRLAMRHEPAIELLRQRRVVVEPFIQSEFPLRNGAEALAAAAQPGGLKILLRPGGVA